LVVEFDGVDGPRVDFDELFGFGGKFIVVAAAHHYLTIYYNFNIYKANSLKKKDYQVMMMLYLMLYFARKWFLAIAYNLMSLVCVIFKLMSTFNLV
jgi:hypothetical protein